MYFLNVKNNIKSLLKNKKMTVSNDVYVYQFVTPIPMKILTERHMRRDTAPQFTSYTELLSASALQGPW